MKISEHFSDTEFACKCCKKIKYDVKLVAKLECLRSAIGNKPIFLTSGYRCEKHNKNVGGAKGSYHLQGKAADIYVKGDMLELEKMADRIFNTGGVGIYKKQGFVHVDVRSGKRRWNG